jgi:hypothetical protein
MASCSLQNYSGGGKSEAVKIIREIHKKEDEYFLSKCDMQIFIQYVVKGSP